MSPALSRRRVIAITAAAAGLALVPLGRLARAEAHLVTWRGSAMGAAASLQLHHRDRAAAERLIERAVAEMRRLERTLSLYRQDSALVALNRRGVLVAPPAELVVLLTESRRVHELTGGAFDPTVQALWTLYRDHFARPSADPQGPPAAAREAALALVGLERVAFDRNRIAFARRGMALTLNGIAQGYASDRVADLLRAEGIEHSLVDMGEARALGSRPDGAPWRVGIADPSEPSRPREVLDVVNRAVATSGAYGFRFDPQGRFNHLFDPRTGASADRYRSLTVIMPTAAAADAFSTAFSLMPRDAIAAALREVGTGEVHLIDADGKPVLLRATPA
jgi:thiamine biosynthesis lipoprotein